MSCRTYRGPRRKREGSYWRSQRRRMQPAFHQQCLEVLDALITGTTVELVRGWREFSESGQAVDVAAEMTRLTLRIIGKALLGVDFASKADSISKAIATMLDAEATLVLCAFQHYNAVSQSPV